MQIGKLRRIKGFPLATNIVPPPLRSLSRDEVIDFFNAKEVNAECPSCGHDTSEIHLRSNDDVTVVVLPGVEISDNGKAAMNPHAGSLVIICECVNCGFYRNFSFYKILEWSDAQRKSHD